MRFLFLEPHPKFGGGMESFSLRLGREITKLGDEVFLAFDKDGDMVSAYEAFCTDTFRVNLNGFRKRRPIQTARELIALNSVIVGSKIDACFSSDLGLIEFGAILRIINGRRWFYHLGLPCIEPSLLRKLSYRWIGGGISPAAHTLESWRRSGWPGRSLHQVRNWVDGKEFAPQPSKTALRKELGLPNDKFLVLFLGRVIAEKGVEVLVEAVRLLGDHEVQLILVGKGEESYVRGLVGGTSSREAVIARPATAEPRKYLAAVDVVCVPSIGEETSPLVALEAMATGTPIVCSDSGNLPDLLGPQFSRFVCRRGDSADIVRCLHFLKNQNTTPKLSAELRRRAELDFGPNEPVSKYRSIMETHT